MKPKLVPAINQLLIAEKPNSPLTNAQFAGHKQWHLSLFQYFFAFSFFLMSVIPQVYGHNYSIPGNALDTDLPNLLIDNSLLPAVDEIPNITVRFANPLYDCDTEQYCLDMEFQSDIPDQELFGMNVRFFYDDSELEIIDFSDFQGGYGPSAGNPGPVGTSPPGFGSTYFNFPSPGVADFVNFSFQKTTPNAPPIYIETAGWTKLLQVCFTIEGTLPDSTNFCPPIVWDLRVDPADGGYLTGDNGIIITVVDGSGSGPTTRNVEQFNWEYIGDGSAPPYGQPVELSCISLICGVSIVCPADVEINCGDSTLPDNTGYAAADGGCEDNPSITYTDSLAAGSCGEGNFIFRTWIVMDSCGNEAACQQIISIDERGMICGTMSDDLGGIMGGVELNLFADLNENATVDAGDTLFAITFSDLITGVYCFDSIPPCSYIIKEVQPLDYGDLFDFDYSPDPDGQDSLDGPDNEIPVVLMPCEIDSNNNFVDIVCPAAFPIVPADTICENGSTVFEIEDLNIGLVTYSWDFGSGSDPASGDGIGPHDVTYIATPENQEGGAMVNISLSKSGCPDTTNQVSVIQINPFPDASIDADTDPGCYYTDRVFQPLQAEIPGADYTWNFGFGAVPATATGYGPHTVYYNLSGSKTVSLVIHPNALGAQCPDSATTSFFVFSCTAGITGTITTTSGNPIQNVNIKLYADSNVDGIADNGTAIKSVYSTATGSYSMAALTPGNYVIVETQPDGWDSFDDGDEEIDNDIVPNIDSLDNLIPVTLGAGEVDTLNDFTEIAIAGMITGYVFVDMDEDQFPDGGEGLSNIPVSLFYDVNTDGVADDNTPIETQLTLADGSFVFPNVPVGDYVIAESQPDGYISTYDGDVSNDGDEVPNTNTTNDTIPVSITNGEVDAGNYFIDVDSCGLIVTNLNDSGTGSFRQAIECAESGDTIYFHASLAGLTIEINSSRLVLDKDLVFYSTISPRVNLSSQITGFFDITAGVTVEFKELNIISGLSGNLGAAFRNDGTLKLNEVNVIRNPLLPPGDYLISNSPLSELILIGNCLLEFD